MLVGDYGSVDENHTPGRAGFEAFKAWGGRAVIVRGGFTFKGQSFGDPCIARDRDAIGEAGLAFGAYLIHGWTVDPAAQVKKLVETVGKSMPGDLPVSLDAESGGELPMSHADAVARLVRTYNMLRDVYPVVQVYTSLRWWTEILGGVDAPELAACPLWLKIPYPYKTKRPANKDVRGELTALPRPWHSGSPGAWIKQFQGDASGVPGFTSQADLSEFLPYRATNAFNDTRTPWVIERLKAHSILTTWPNIAIAIETFQRTYGLAPDGVIGPASYAALCA